jgi:NAD(P)-dependent dehydrogenase (short-subunit alcohol dehydrogenase family)
MRTLQQPIGSGFGSASTATDVIRDTDLAGKTAIVTGGYSGLGRKTVRVLLAAGARVIVPSRHVPRATAALMSIPDVEVMEMDLLDPASIDSFADSFMSGSSPLHILINNAGIMACPLARDKRGFEHQFATNHLGHFQLTASLWPALRRARGARVISVSSRAHWFSTVNFDDPNFEHRPYDPWLAYGQSKTANVLFAVELDRRGQHENIRAFSLHPGGIVETGLGKFMTREQIRQAGGLDEHDNPVVDPARGLKNVEQGASTIVWCATNPKLARIGGVYCEDNDIAPLSKSESGESVPNADTLKRGGVMPYAVDPAAARRLWHLSERLLGISTNLKNCENANEQSRDRHRRFARDRHRHHVLLHGEGSAGDVDGMPLER